MLAEKQVYTLPCTNYVSVILIWLSISH